ncbi:MAG TPA: hypothetical protein VFJ94_10750 [Intrasporangium sp.]|uniref:hypothetical protein n=1 Tax=Intrasporangium sp. TaxID=1925024 RepID=UPI002D79DFF0|nr:hypothetical protein [Intrasporangium sp.]HET7398989.1 hypothetical protein [Intrasporangium sp.]
MAQNQDAYGEGDFVKVVDAGGNVQPNEVPKAWVGTDLLPEGWKQAPKAAVSAEEKTAAATAEAEIAERVAAETAASPAPAEEKAATAKVAAEKSKAARDASAS